MIRFRSVVCMALAFLVFLQAAVIPVSASEAVVQPQGTEQALAAEETIPAETAPLETAPAETELEATEPVDTEPQIQETDPIETVPAEIVLSETEEAANLLVEVVPEETEPPAVQFPVPLYFQTDYPITMYGTGTIGNNGCSITCLAMVATYLTGIQYLPDELAGYFGGYGANNMERLEYGSQMLQLPYTRPANFHETLAELRAGKVAIALMNPKSIFTDSQHFIVLAGVTEDGKILVNDPYKPNYDRWDLENAFRTGFEVGDISCGFSGAWVYDPAAMPEEPFFYAEEQPQREKSRYEGLQLTAEERKLLASVVWVEAQGETPEGQQAVAEVILNRVVSGQFQDTVKGVLYAEGQFRSVAYLDTAQPSQAQYEAIDNALYGPYILPMEVYHFATYPATENVWGQIGGHIFCYGW